MGSVLQATKVGQWTIEISRDGGFSWTENGAYFSVADVCGSNIGSFRFVYFLAR